MTGRFGPNAGLLLDRDGVINFDRGYVHKIEDFEFIPGVFDLVRFAVDHKMPVAVVTNQSGIARGLFDEATFERLTEWMLAQFGAAGAPIDRVYHCPYHPTEGIGPWRIDHPWRKPSPGMLFQAATDLHLDLAVSAMIGDSTRDIQAAHAAGVGLSILHTANPVMGYQCASDLAEARDLLEGWLLKISGDRSLALRQDS